MKINFCDCGTSALMSSYIIIYVDSSTCREVIVVADSIVSARAKARKLLFTLFPDNYEFVRIYVRLLKNIPNINV